MTTFIFPGQGSQYLQMGKEFHDNFKVAKEIFEEIEDYTSINLRNIIFSDNDRLLNQTDVTQLSIFATSISIFKTLLKENYINFKHINFMLGHSLGEYSALTCSQKIDIKNASLLLKRRGELMHKSLKENTYGMAALIGLSVENVEKIINEKNLDLEVANDNSPIQVVVSGKIENLNSYEDIFKKNNIKKYVILNVSSAFHSKHMLNAQSELNKFMENIFLNENNINIISNFSAKSSNNNIEILNSLRNQMANRVRWTESIKQLELSGEKEIIEIGPGKILSGLIKRITNYFDIKTINKVSDLELI